MATTVTVINATFSPSCDGLTDDFRSFVKYSYCGGLLSPILDWIFLFYIISRVNSKSHGRSSSNPNFLDGSDDYADIADNDGMVVESHSGDKQVLFEDLRKDYSRPLYNRSSTESKEKINTSKAHQVGSKESNSD